MRDEDMVEVGSREHLTSTEGTQERVSYSESWVKA